MFGDDFDFGQGRDVEPKQEYPGEKESALHKVNSLEWTVHDQTRQWNYIFNWEKQSDR